MTLTVGTLEQGLLGHWPLSDASIDGGTVRELTPNRYAGEQRGGVTTGIDTPLGTGTGCSFDGTDDYIALDMSFNSSSAIPEMTVTAWVRSTASPPDWSFLDFDRSEYFTFGFNDSGGEIQFGTDDGGGIHDLYSTNTWNDGTWHHVAAVYDGTDKYIYIDGTDDGSASNPHGGSPIGTGTLRYGFIGDGSEANSFDGSHNGKYYDGDLADVRLYGRALSKPEISMLADMRAHRRYHL